MVTVLCPVFNHFGYIRQCLESLVMQETDFVYEVIVRDDASTDGTDRIIREFAEKSLTDCANDWLQDSLEDGEPFIEITEERFAQRMVLNSIGYDENGFDVYYDDDDMFWGHCILVYGTLENGIEEAQIAG